MYILTIIITIIIIMYNCRYLPIGVSVYTYTVSCLDSPVGAIHDERVPTGPLDVTLKIGQ